LQSIILYYICTDVLLFYFLIKAMLIAWFAEYGYALQTKHPDLLISSFVIAAHYCSRKGDGFFLSDTGRKC